MPRGNQTLPCHACLSLPRHCLGRKDHSSRQTLSSREQPWSSPGPLGRSHGNGSDCPLRNTGPLAYGKPTIYVRRHSPNTISPCRRWIRCRIPLPNHIVRWVCLVWLHLHEPNERKATRCCRCNSQQVRSLRMGRRRGLSQKRRWSRWNSYPHRLYWIQRFPIRQGTDNLAAPYIPRPPLAMGNGTCCPWQQIPLVQTSCPHAPRCW